MDHPSMCFQVADERTEKRRQYLSNKAEEVQVMPLASSPPSISPAHGTENNFLSPSEDQSNVLVRGRALRLAAVRTWQKLLNIVQ